MSVLAGRSTMAVRTSPDDPLFQTHVPVTFRWPYEADEVYVTGDWNEFKLTPDHRLSLDVAKKDGSPAVFKLTLMLLPGIHRYKFYVNNSWEIDPKKPVTLGGMSNLLVVGAPTNVDLSRKIAGDVSSEEWDLIGWKLNEAWFISAVVKVVAGCRSKLKTLKIEDMKSINGKLLAAILQEQASAEDFSRQLTLAPELYANCDAGDFVALLFDSMVQSGDKDNLAEFLFSNIRKSYSGCPKCNYSGDMLSMTSIFMLNVPPTSKGANLESMVTENLQMVEVCPKCAQGQSDVTVSFETLPRFLLLNTGAYFSTQQISPSVCIQNQTAGEKHYYDLIGCNTVTATTSHQAITRVSPGRWTLTVGDDVSDLPTWEHAVKRMAFGKATLFVFERFDIRRDRLASSSSSSNIAKPGSPSAHGATHVSSSPPLSPRSAFKAQNPSFAIPSSNDPAPNQPAPGSD